MTFRAVLLDETLRRVGLPLRRITADGPEWTRALTPTEQTRADAIVTRFALLSDPLSDAQVKTIRDRITQEEWQRKLDGDPDLRVLFVVARRLYGTMRQLHPALPPFADFVAAVKADLDAEPVP